MFSQRSAVALRVRVLRRGTQCFMVWNIYVSGTILTCLMVGSGLKIPLAGAIFWMYFILVLLFRQLCYVYPYCEKVQKIMKNHEKRRYFLNLESTDFNPPVSEFHQILKYKNSETAIFCSEGVFSPHNFSISLRGLYIDLIY